QYAPAVNDVEGGLQARVEIQHVAGFDHVVVLVPVPGKDVLRGLDRDLVDVDREHPGRAEAQCGERVEARPAADVEERTSLERLDAEQSLQLRRRMLDPPLIEQTAELLPVPAELECGGPIVCRR